MRRNKPQTLSALMKNVRESVSPYLSETGSNNVAKALQEAYKLGRTRNRVITVKLIDSVLKRYL